MTVHDHPERTKAIARGDQAERLVQVALDFALLVRDEGPGAIASFLERLTSGDRYRLLTVLAAMVPVDDMSADQLLAHVTWDEFGMPLPGATPVLRPGAEDVDPATAYEDCGTVKAWYRHVRAGDKTAEAEACGCAQAYRDHRNTRNAAASGRPARDPEGNQEIFARHRAEGATPEQAAEWTGVSPRTGWRYEQALREQQEEAAAS